MDKLLAALGFFTRIPFWRLRDIPAEAYRRVVDLWPVAGLLTGGITALTLWGASYILPPLVAVIVAYGVRVLLTGALHEDGLADFIDGFGGGRDRQRILEIMKDSGIGSYGVIGLLFWFLLTISCVSSLPPHIAPLIVLAADTWSKFCGSLLVDFLPYARKESEAKNKLIYDRMSTGAFLLCLFIGILPSLALPHIYLLSLCLPLLLALLMIPYLRYKIGGYTGDCCGAAAMICEGAFILSATIITSLICR